MTAVAGYTPQAFDALYAASDDPWHFRDSDYEARKRALTLAALPPGRFALACEPGCSNGELTAMLATRCDRLQAYDGAAAAVSLARRRVAGLAGVSVEQAWMPRDWPRGVRFDLVVLSEFLYYLPPSDLPALADVVAACLAASGVVLACHWRHPIDGCAWRGDAVHQALLAHWRWPVTTRIVDRDFVLDVWQRA